jgi:hypothetical protein
MDAGFGNILDQDTDNLILQQQALEASTKRGLTLGKLMPCAQLPQVHGHGTAGSGLEGVAAGVIAN